MDWQNERWIKLYTRDTPDWLCLSWDAQALMHQLLRKVDRGGRLELGKAGKVGVAIVLGQRALWESRIEPALDELLADGCVQLESDTLTIRNFAAAQEATQSPAARKAAQRERDAVSARMSQNVTVQSQNVTSESRKVTAGHEMSLEREEREEREQKREKISCSEPLALELSEPATEPATEPALLAFETAGTPSEWAFTAAFSAELCDAYPGVDVLAEAKKARLWVKSNPTKRKTARGMRRFLAGWMEREQNRGRAPSAPTGAPWPAQPPRLKGLPHG